MKPRLRCIGAFLTTSVITTFVLHTHVYFNHERIKRVRRMVGDQILRDKIFATPLSVQTLSRQEPFPTTTQSKTTVDVVQTESAASNKTVSEKNRKSEPSARLDVTRKKQKCHHNSSKLLGPLKVNSSYQPPEKEVLTAGGELLREGCYKPPDCISLQKVAFVIPYKNRYRHLLTLLHHMHPILQRQKITYCVFIAEQYDEGTFNKARVMNAVFREVTEKWTNHQDQEGRPFDCFVFHDVDMLLEDDRNLYLCADMPKHLSPAIDKFNYTTGYGTQYGGVTAMKTEHYIKVNGHSNRFWGWGGEDNDMEMRINKTGLRILSAHETIGRYKMIPHHHPWWFSPISGVGSSYRIAPKPHSRVFERRTSGSSSEDLSGLSNINYLLMKTEKTKLWSKLTLDIRSQEVENATIHFAFHKEPDVSVYSMSTIRSRNKEKQAAASSAMAKDLAEGRDDVKCEPTYHFFRRMTVNRTVLLSDDFYNKIYHSLTEAQAICTAMETNCHAIVEQMKGRFTLRANAYVQENTIRYKYGLAEQHDVTEQHFSNGVYVKICPGDPRYTQFFLEPIVMAGDATTGPAPRYHMDLYLRLFHASNLTYVYQSQLMTSHRAIMEEKIARKTIKKPWWDSMGRIQFNRAGLVSLSDEARLKPFIVDEKKGSKLLRIRSPVNGLLRVPGCYVVRNTIIAEETNSVVLEWTWWFQLRALTEEIEKSIQEKILKKSIDSGKEFNEMMERRRKLVEHWQHERKLKELENRRP